MKKLLLVLSAMFFCVAANAQSDMDSDGNNSSFKPVAGDWTAEFAFAPLGGSPIGLDNLRFRYFTEEMSAFRLNVGIYYNSDSDPVEVMNSAGAPVTVEDKNSNFQINLRPGIEKHFEGTGRLSPYIGGEVDFAIASSKNTSETLDARDAVVETETKNEDGFLRIGLNALAGFDFYVAKKLYIGAEMGFGFNITSNSDIEFTPPVGDSVTTDRGSEFHLGPNTIGTLRLGFVF